MRFRNICQVFHTGRKKEDFRYVVYDLCMRYLRHIRTTRYGKIFSCVILYRYIIRIFFLPSRRYDLAIGRNLEALVRKSNIIIIITFVYFHLTSKFHSMENNVEKSRVFLIRKFHLFRFKTIKNRKIYGQKFSNIKNHR